MFCIAICINISLQIAPRDRSKLQKPKHSISQAYNTMNLKLYQKIYIVTNEQCIRLTVPNARFQRYLRGLLLFVVTLPAEHRALSLIKCPAVTNAAVNYGDRLTFLHFLLAIVDRGFVIEPTIHDCCNHFLGVRFFVISFPVRQGSLNLTRHRRIYLYIVYSIYYIWR